MAIFHCRVLVISRSAGRSVCAATAYHAAEKIKDERTGITHDFTHKGGVLYSEILAPAGSPVWAIDRAELWNHVEKREEESTRRATATTAREFRLALPHELNLHEQIAVAHAFGQYLVNKYGVAVDYSIHAPDMEGDDRNFHVHMLISDRRLTDAGFAGKLRELSPQNGGRAHIVAIRKQWAESVNQHLGTAGSIERVDHRSYKAQSIDLEPTIHLGVAATALERRGEMTERGNFNRNVAEINAIRVELKTLGAELHVLELAETYEGKKAAQIDAIKKANAATIIELTTTRSTFTAQDVDATTDKAAALSGQYQLGQQRATESPKPLASKITLEEMIKEAETQAKAAKELRLLKQHKLDQQKATETPKPSATKRTLEEMIKEAKAEAKVARELRRQLERDSPSLGRGR